MRHLPVLLASGLLLSSALHAAAPSWFRGNTHTHTLWSDGDQLPELAAHWYKAHGYDFLVLSDHNVLSRGDKWVDVTGLDARHGILARSRELFGDPAVTTRTDHGKTLVKLNTLAEVRSMVCKPGEFLMIEGDEITGSHGHRPAHANAINIDRCILPAKGATMAEQLAAYATEVKQHGHQTGRPVFLHINHPNWKFSNTAEEVAAASDADGIEIMNPSCDNSGDAVHPSTDRMWDIVNTIRLRRDRLPPLFGCATDDTHSYHVPDLKKSNPGRAWIMVRAPQLTADAIVHAMRRGDFYASTGVTLENVTLDPEKHTLSVKVDAAKDTRYRIEFIGTPRNVDLTASPVPATTDPKGHKSPVTAEYSNEIGMILQQTIDVTEATYRLTGNELYVRARVTNLSAQPLQWDQQPLQPAAWTQPVGWRDFLKRSP